MTINLNEFQAGVPVLPMGQSGAVSLAAKGGLVARPHKAGFYRNVFKRVLDLTLCAIAAPVVLPVVAALAVGVARDGGKPFYSQMRVGKGGRRFRMWKLRSMVLDADARMEEFLTSNPEARLEWDANQKLRDDPRITRFGRFIRKTSMDELPQLWNVVMGEMSLVGPRPMMISQQAIYPGQDYYDLKPGITGYWQTAGRHRTTFEARAEYDAAYNADIGLATDVKLLARTIGVVVKGTGC